MEELKGNKGEWSEIYAFLKILGDKVIYAGDEYLNQIANTWYPIIKVIREQEGNHIHYRISGNEVVVVKNDEELLREPVSEFKNKAEELLSKIRVSEGAFSSETTQHFLEKIKCDSIKANSTEKTDIHLVYHDSQTRIDEEMGFSIKSYLGAKPTLLNASKATNFYYKVVGSTLTDDVICSINSIDTVHKISERVNAIYNNNCRLEFCRMANRVFQNNLIMSDSLLPHILSEMVLEYYHSEFSTVKEITERIIQLNPLNYDLSSRHNYYEHKIKNFLVEIALGMVPGSVWNGRYEANGGYIIVKKDGNILCYHFHDRNLLEDYLYNNTKFDTGSSSPDKSDFGTLFKDTTGETLIRLNLQIRFI